MRYCFLDGCGRLVSGNVLIVDFAVCIAFQCQDECRVVTQVVFREREAERLDQMKLASRIGAEANDIARIGRDLRTNKNYVKHAGD